MTWGFDPAEVVRQMIVSQTESYKLFGLDF